MPRAIVGYIYTNLMPVLIQGFIYKDDIILVEDTPQKLQVALNERSEEVQKRGMAINPEKKS